MLKSEKLFLLVVASIPIQLGRYFFLPYSYVLGLPIDYLALTIYLSDLVILAFLIVFFLENIKKIPAIFQKFKTFILIVGLFNFYLFVQALFISPQEEVSLFFSLKTFLFSLFALFSATLLSQKALIPKTLLVLKIILILESAILIGEFIIQRSLNLTFLGERTFDASTVSIAHVDLFGQQLLRAYGTFPHPNVAAAFLVFGLITIIGQNKRKDLVKHLTTSLTLAGLVVTFSKSALIILPVSAILAFSKKGKVLIFFGLVIASFMLTSSISNSQIATISERLLLAQKSLDIALVNPLFGVGSNNFILELSKLNLFTVSQIRLLQPVHNLFFLILAENGIFGLLLFAGLLLTVAKRVDTKTKTALFIAILIFASLDHFLWTLQQGRLLFWLTVAYIISSPPGKKILLLKILI